MIGGGCEGLELSDVSSKSNGGVFSEGGLWSNSTSIEGVFSLSVGGGLGRGFPVTIGGVNTIIAGGGGGGISIFSGSVLSGMLRCTGCTGMVVCLSFFIMVCTVGVGAAAVVLTLLDGFTSLLACCLGPGGLLMVVSLSQGAGASDVVSAAAAVLFNNL